MELLYFLVDCIPIIGNALLDQDVNRLAEVERLFSGLPVLGEI